VGRHTIFITSALTLVWCILMESFTWQNAAIGAFASMLSVHIVSKFFKFEEISNVNFYKLASYPFWLVSRIYIDAFFLIKLILSRPKWGIMKMSLTLENEALRVMLADSVTLTPGSVYLERVDEKITLLCIGHEDIEGYPATQGDVRWIEKLLGKSEIKPGDGEQE